MVDVEVEEEVDIPAASGTIAIPTPRFLRHPRDRRRPGAVRLCWHRHRHRHPPCTPFCWAHRHHRSTRRWTPAPFCAASSSRPRCCRFRARVRSRRVAVSRSRRRRSRAFSGQKTRGMGRSGPVFNGTSGAQGRNSRRRRMDPTRRCIERRPPRKRPHDASAVASSAARLPCKPSHASSAAATCAYYRLPGRHHSDARECHHSDEHHIQRRCCRCCRWGWG
jgi:hypothetical protein